MNASKNVPRINISSDPAHQADYNEFLSNKPMYKKIQYHPGNAQFIFVVFGEIKLKSKSLAACVAARQAWMDETGNDYRSNYSSKLDFATNKDIKYGKVTVPFNPIKDAWILPGCILERNQTYALAAAKRINHFLGN